MGTGRIFGLACFGLSLLLLSPSNTEDTNAALPILTNMPLPLVEFSNSSGATLVCETSQQDTTVKWYLKDGTPVSDVKGLREIDSDGNLNFPPFSAEVFRQDVHATIYKCTATNSLGTIVSHDIQVKAVVNQPYDIYVYDVYAMQGNTAVMRCHIPSFLTSYVNVTAWIRDSVVVIKSTQMDKNSKYSLMPSGELFIKDVELKDGMTSFQCQTYNRLTETTLKSSMSGKLFVTESQGNVPPKIVLSETKISVRQGQSAYLPCEVQANPPAQTSWEKIEPHDDIKTAFNGRHIQMSGSLVIKTVRPSDNGTYRCLSSNSVGQEYVDTHLFVIEPLSVSTEFQSVIVDVGKSTSFSCKISGDPIQNRKWLKDGKPVELTHKVVLNNDNKTITIASASAGDKGIYQCCAVNEFEEVCGSTALILGDVPPVLVDTFTAAIKNPGENIKLKCTAQGNPKPLISWFLDDNELKNNDKIRIEETKDARGNSVAVLVIVNIRTEDGGLYKCEATNRAGKTFHWSRINVYGPIGSRQTPTLNVVNGANAILNCPIYGYPLADIQWKKDEQVLPQDMRQVQHLNDSLIINDVRRTLDSGHYICTVNGHEKTVEGNIQVKVLVAPKLSPFSFQDELVQEGSRGRLQCVVVEGDIPLKLQWLKDGNVIPSNSGITVRDIDEFSSILTIAAIKPRHNGKYTCMASNAAGIDSFSTNLAVNVPPKIVPFAFQDEHLVEGSLLRISCVVSRGDLPLIMKWQKDGRELPESVTVKEFDSYSTVLSIASVKREHSGNYTCKAQNQAGIATYNAELVVQVPPSWIVQPISQTVKTGGMAYFHCQANGYPTPTISWMFAKESKGSTGQPIRSDSETLILSNGTLILKNVLKTKEGRYGCLASNGIGHNLNTVALLSILAPPNFQVKTQPFNKKFNSAANFTCAPRGDFPMNITWSIGDDSIQVKKDPRIIITTEANSSVSVLTIKQLNRTDSTTYTCKAENSFGNDKMIFVLNVQEPPEAPILESNSMGGNRSVFLTWSKPFDGNSHIVGYMIQYKRQVDNWQLKKLNESVDGSKTATKIENLQPATSYTFRVLAENAIGVSSFSNEVVQTTDMDVPTGSVQNVEIEAIDGNTLRISWKAPRKDTWNGAIRGYNIGYRENGSNTVYEFSALEVPEDYTEDLIYQISNLKKYTMYTVVIQAYNDKGAGPLSEPMLVMTSEDVPSIAPEGLRCSALSAKSIYVLWEPLSPNDVNGILRGYKVIYKPITEWYDSQVQFKTSEKEKFTLQNLDVNTNYSIAVLAYTKVGDGIKTEPVYCKTHEDVPDRPSEIKVLPSSYDSVFVAWKPPKRINGETVKYNIYYRPLSESEEKGKETLLKTEQSKSNNVHTFQSDMEYFEVKGLKKNQRYAFWVSATSAIGEGQHSDVIAQNVAESAVPATSASFDDVVQTPWKRDITLPCRGVGIPTPQRKWTVGNSLVSTGGRKVLLSDGTLLINKVDSEDGGNYTCTIYNTHGKDQVHYSLNVQVPPSSPILDIISKTRSSIQLQWKSGQSGGDDVKGYVLHYRRDGGEWETVELSADKELFTLSNLACGVNYQIFMEAFNKIGKGLPCDIIKVSTEGSEVTIPTKEQLLHEGSTYVSVHLEAWPITSCPVRSFQVEYKALFGDEWTTVSSSIRPTQRKLVIPGLVPATWYALRVTANTNGDPVSADYQFATRTVNGATIPPPEIKVDKPQAPVYIFYLDPYIFIPAVALLIVVIIASAVLCIYMKRKNGSVGTPSDYGTVDNWHGSGKGSSYTASTLYATIPHHKRHRNDPNPYASGRVGDYYPDSDAWVESRTLTRGNPHLYGVRVLPQRMCETMQQTLSRPGPSFQETTFEFGNASQIDQQLGDYDKPPKGM